MQEMSNLIFWRGDELKVTIEETIIKAVEAALLPKINKRFDDLEDQIAARKQEAQDEADRMLTLSEVAEHLKCSKQTVVRMCNDGRLKAPEGSGMMRRWHLKDLKIREARQ